MGQWEVGWKGCEQGQEGPAAVPVLERRGTRAPPECPAHPAPTATGSASESRAARRKRARGGCIPLLSPGLPMQPTISIHSGENPDYPPEARTPLAEGRGAPCPGQVRMGECGVPGERRGHAQSRGARVAALSGAANQGSHSSGGTRPGPSLRPALTRACTVLAFLAWTASRVGPAPWKRQRGAVTARGGGWRRAVTREGPGAGRGRAGAGEEAAARGNVVAELAGLGL